ncbi:hypothetical protein ACFL1X_00875 [Candidatus Hydrogenedentota bacterium]
MRIGRLPVVVLNVVFLGTLLLGSGAFAWGTEAHRQITLFSLQAVRQEIPNLLLHRRASMLEGTDVPEEYVWNYYYSMDEDRLQNIEMDMYTIKVAAKNRMSDFVAFRCGVLSKYLADSVLPFAMEAHGKEGALKRDYEFQIEEHLKELDYGFVKRKFLHFPSVAFKELYDTRDKASEYARVHLEKRTPYDEYLAKATDYYFTSSVNALANLLFTIFSGRTSLAGSQFQEVPPQTLARFYAQEIVYAVDHRHKKGALEEAGAAYEDIEVLGVRSALLYEIVADSYRKAYIKEREEIFLSLISPEPPNMETVEKNVRKAIRDYGERAMHEYRKALKYSKGPEIQKRLKEKIFTFYYSLGQENFSQIPPEYEKAREYYEQILKVLPSETRAQVAKNKITLLEAKLAYRRARFDYFIQKARELQEEALLAKNAKNYSIALSLYLKARVVFGLVDETFEDLKADADHNEFLVKQEQHEVVEFLLKEAGNKISEAQQKISYVQSEQDFDNALTLVDQAVALLSAITPEYSGDQYFDAYNTAQENIEKAQALRGQIQTQKSQHQPLNTGPDQANAP